MLKTFEKSIKKRYKLAKTFLKSMIVNGFISQSKTQPSCGKIYYASWPDAKRNKNFPLCNDNDVVKKGK